MHVIGLAEKMTDQKLHSAIFDRRYRKAVAETGFEQFSGLQWGSIWQPGGQSDRGLARFPESTALATLL